MHFIYYLCINDDYATDIVFECFLQQNFCIKRSKPGSLSLRYVVWFGNAFHILIFVFIVLFMRSKTKKGFFGLGLRRDRLRQNVPRHSL